MKTINKKHNYIKPPLPFRGNKRNFLSLIKKIDFSNKIVVDLFGGSGIISHTIKANNPTATVIYNDFDNYRERIKNIKNTEKTRVDIISYLNKTIYGKKLSSNAKLDIVEIIKDNNCNDFITLSSWLLFSGKHVDTLEDLIKLKPWYNNVPVATLNATHYLDDVQIVSVDYATLLKKYKNKDVIFIVDPPYVMTSQTSYKNKDFITEDAVNLISLLAEEKSLFFSSTKSQLEEIFKLFDFSSIKKHTRTSTINYSSKYTELMFLFNWGESLDFEVEIIK